MKVFWSWQSDTPGKTGRHFVKNALREAIEELKQAPDVEEPQEREIREELHLDHDIQGTTGSPDLVQTILEKIDISAVFIADVTAVGQIFSGTEGEIGSQKKLINSNVALELGYALKALSAKRVLIVFNEYYGSRADVPFDLRHKGGAILFHLPPGADSATIKAEHTKLKNRFVAAIKPFLEEQRPQSASFPEMASTFSKASYFQPSEVLARFGDAADGDELEYSYAESRLCYVRLIPTAVLRHPLSLAKLMKAVQRVPILRSRDGVISDRNQYGAIRLEPGSHPPSGSAKIKGSTQLFPNGEIWSISAALIVAKPNGRPAHFKYPFLPYLGFEQAYYDAVHDLISFARQELELSAALQLECGLTGIKGAYLAADVFEGQTGPLFTSEVVDRTIVNRDDRAAINQALLSFFEKVYDLSGYERPRSLYGFPPARPADRP